MIKKILVAYDASSPAEKAFAFGLEIAKKYDAVLIALAVAQPPEPPGMVETEAVLENATTHFKKFFTKLKEKAKTAGVQLRCEVKVGHPAEQIIHMANEESADMIAMGHRGKGLVERWLVGSISKRVLSYAHCTVVVVR